MTLGAASTGASRTRHFPLIAQTLERLDRVPIAALSLGARIFSAAIFWQSGETKVSGWKVTDSAIALFQQEYRLPFIDPSLAAYVSAFAEHFFPVLLVLGLASRVSALALLVMIVVIEIFVYPEAWPTHGIWAISLLLIMFRGPGVLSLDYLIKRHFLGA